jgi:hypothetical protein
VKSQNTPVVKDFRERDQQHASRLFRRQPLGQSSLNAEPGCIKVVDTFRSQPRSERPTSMHVGCLKAVLCAHHVGRHAAPNGATLIVVLIAGNVGLSIFADHGK